MREHGVIALVNVPIFLPGRVAYGVLQVDATRPRDFDDEDIAFLRTYAMVLGPVIDRFNKARDLAHTTERYRLIVQNARDYAIFLTDAEDRITDWLPGAEAVFGWSEPEALGQPAAIIFTPEDRRAGVPEEETELARRDGKAPNVRWHVRKDGQRVFIDGQTTALRRADGVVTGFMKIGQDVSERKKAEEATRGSEERLRLALESGHLATWDWDLASGKIEWSEEHFRLQGYEVGEVEPSYEAWLDRVHCEDRAEVLKALGNARDHGAAYRVEFRSPHPDGTVVWCSALGRFFYDEQGQATRMIGVMQDVSERRRWEAQQEVLVAELQHRTRNLMGVVRSVADKTIRTSADLTDFRERFSDRIDALARVQGLLSRLGDQERVAFDQLLDTELSAMNAHGKSIGLHGPRNVRLRSSTVQTLAMALHELATNAVKYGALGQADGALTISWRIELPASRGEPWLHIDWSETGVAMRADERPQGGGQGRELIERALPYQLGAKTTYALTPEGVHCTIALPVSASNQDGERTNVRADA